jgi:cell division protein FtsQ
VVVARSLAILLLCAASGLLYHVASAEEFRVARVVVAGNELVSAAELEVTAAVDGANIFCIRLEEVEQRLQALPAVQSARVTTFLPNGLQIQIAERTPVAIWQSGGTAYLVDQQGQVVGIGGAMQRLTRIRDLDGSDLRPGARVDADALVTTTRLETLLPAAARMAVRGFEYSRATGVEVLADFGPRVRFGDSEHLEWKASALAAIRRDLDRTGQRAELIDLRFMDRPYIR